MDCNNECKPILDITQFADIYDELNVKVRKVLQEDYDCKKINGATYAATWAAMMSPAVGQILGALVSLETKETNMDRCVKQEQCDASKAKTIQNECMAQADCELKDAQEKKVEYETSHILPQNVRLVKRQVIGFDDNKTIKAFNAGMSAWGLAFSSGLLNSTPNFVNNQQLTSTYNALNSPTSV